MNRLEGNNISKSHRNNNGIKNVSNGNNNSKSTKENITKVMKNVIKVSK